MNKSASTHIRGQTLKSLIEDHAKPHHEVILNWKEIENAAAHPIREWMLEAYKKIYYLVQLLQFFVVKSGDS